MKLLSVVILTVVIRFIDGKGTCDLHSEEGEPLLSWTTDLQDAENDCWPRYLHAQYNATVEENRVYISPNSIDVHPKIHLFCNDQSADIQYSLQVMSGGSDIKDAFEINATTGKIHLLHPLDYEHTYSRIDILLSVKVTNKATGYSNQSTALLFVDIADIDDNRPMMMRPSYSVNVTENEPIGRLLLVVSASDADSGVNAMFQYQQDGGCPIHVNKNDGHVYLSSNLDYEKRARYFCHIYAQETAACGYRSIPSRIQINVIDVNDNSPIFTETEYHFVLGWPTFDRQYIGKVIANDLDSGLFGSVTYTIVGAHSQKLSINNSTGAMYLNGIVFNNNETKTFEVLAFDKGSPPRESQAVVKVRTVKGYQRWFFQQESYNLVVPESFPKDTDIGRVIVNSSQVTYSILGPKDIPFRITKSGGAILLERTLDHEGVQNMYFFEVQASDPFLNVSVSVTVTVTDVNDNAPYFISPDNHTRVIYVGYTYLSETPIFTFRALDKDSGSNGVVSYKKSSLVDNFELNEKTGNLYLRYAAFNYARKEYQLTVEAVDNGTPSLTTSVDMTVKILVPTGPLLTEYIYKKLKENNAGNYTLNLNIRKFKDIGRELRFQLSTSWTSIFSIANAPNRLVIQRNSLDYESRRFYELTIHAYGQQSGNYVGIIYVEIVVENDVNDDRLIFLQPATKTFSLPTTAKIDEPVFQFLLEPSSLIYGRNISFSLLINTIGSFKFDSGTGVLSLSGKLRNYDTLHAVCEVTDGIHKESQRVTFHAHEPKNGYPHFDKLAYFGKIPENAAIGTRIFTADPLVSGTQPHDVIFNVLGSNGSFTLDALRGELLSNARFDREKKSQYSIGLQATNAHNAALITTVFAVVSVEDVNDNPPLFPFHRNRTFFNSSDPAGVEVAKIEAIDLDSDAKLNYTISPIPTWIGSHQENNVLYVNVDDPSQAPNTTTLNISVWDGITMDTMLLILEKIL